MLHFNLIAMMLPILFMLHDLEEIIMFKKWLNNNAHDIRERFPKLKVILNKAELITTPAFTVVVAEEFLLLSTISFTALYYSYYDLWVAAFMAFFLHLFIHIGQCILFRRYVPGVLTSLLLLPICVYILTQIILPHPSYTGLKIVTLSAAGFVIMIANLVLMHYLANKLKI